MQAHKEVQYRYYISPETALLPIYRYLDFNLGNTREIIKRGQVDMKKVIEMGPGKSFDKVRNLTRNAVPRAGNFTTTGKSESFQVEI